MKKYLTSAVAALALTLSASARDVDSQNDWVMLTLGWSNGTGAYTMNKGFVPEFANKGQCQVALARALQNMSRADPVPSQDPRPRHFMEHLAVGRVEIGVHQRIASPHPQF